MSGGAPTTAATGHWQCLEATRVLCGTVHSCRSALEVGRCRTRVHDSYSPLQPAAFPTEVGRQGGGSTGDINSHSAMPCLTLLPHLPLAGLYIRTTLFSRGDSSSSPVSFSSILRATRIIWYNALEGYPGGIPTPGPSGSRSRYAVPYSYPRFTRRGPEIFLVKTVPLLLSADGTDWVSPEYMIDQRANPIQDTADAKKSLVGIAGTYGRKGPWSKCSTSVSFSLARRGVSDCDF